MAAGLAEDAVETREAFEHLGKQQNVELLQLALVRHELRSDVGFEPLRRHRAHFRRDAERERALVRDRPGREDPFGVLERVHAPICAKHVRHERIEMLPRLRADESVFKRPAGFVIQRLDEIYGLQVVSM
eukprot:30294-Pelagococcus_subviridis.AAC.72